MIYNAFVLLCPPAVGIIWDPALASIKQSFMIRNFLIVSCFSDRAFECTLIAKCFGKRANLFDTLIPVEICGRHFKCIFSFGFELSMHWISFSKIPIAEGSMTSWHYVRWWLSIDQTKFTWPRCIKAHYVKYLWHVIKASIDNFKVSFYVTLFA